MAEEGTSQKQRYVWDRDKLAWVEAPEKAKTQEEASRAESAAKSTYEEPLEEAEIDISPVEDVAEAEGLQLRGAWIRLVGVAIDFLLLGIFNLILDTVFDIADTGIGTYMLPIIGIAYFIGFWAWRGQTPGKMAIGAKIVRLDGSPVGLGRSILRYIGYFTYIAAIQLSFAWVGWYMGVIAFIIIFLLTALNRQKRGPHDRIAGTAVINTRPKPLEDYEEEEEYEEAYEAEEEAEAYVSEDN